MRNPRTHSDRSDRADRWQRVFAPAGRAWLGVACALALAGVSCGAEDPRDGSLASSLPGVGTGPPGDPPTLEAAGSQAVEAVGKSSGRRPRGLWVLCEGSQRVLDDPARIDPLLSRAAALGVSDLFVQVYRGGRAWYDASLADASPYRFGKSAHQYEKSPLGKSGTGKSGSDGIGADGSRIDPSGSGLGATDRSGGAESAGGYREVSDRDALRELIRRAHESGIRVHAWVNVLSLSLNRDALLIQDLGPDAVLVDRQGRSLLDYPNFEVPGPDGAWYRMGTRGVYLDPAAPGVADRLVAIFAELVKRYPELDGLHLDYIRYPMVLPIAPGSRFGVGLDFGYGAATRERFRRETGLSGPYLDREPTDSSTPNSVRALVNANAWDAWRRDQVTALVRRIGERLDLVHPNPKLLLSAAVIPYADRAYLSIGQDWRRWLEDGLLDFAVPMVYTKDTRLFRYQLESFAAGPHADHLWAGHGSWLFSAKPDDALAQLAIAARSGLGGDALFSYDAIADSPALLAALVGEWEQRSRVETLPAEPAGIDPLASGPSAGE